MSASHTPSPGPTPGQTPTGTAGTNVPLPAFMRRRKQGANPLVKKKQPLQRSIARAPPATAQVNGRPGTAESQLKSNGVGILSSSAPILGSTPQQDDYIDIPIITTKREMLEGLRTHVMRFLPNASAQVKHVDPMDEQQFVRPVKLHRRDPRTDNSLRWKDGSGSAAEDGKPDKMDEKERERLEILKAERKAEREANQALIAPVTKTVPVSKKNNFQKKTEQVFQVGDNAGKKKALQLRYEEALPWHVEDFDGTNIWAGTYESALSDCYVLLIPEGEGSTSQFRMVPVEKWYKFTAKNLFKALSIDEAEARMNKKIKDPRWFMDTQKENEQKQKQESLRKAGSRLFTRTGERGERRVKDEGDGDDEKPEVAADADDIDYNYDEAFADDEENVLFGGDDEENKEAEEKIKREQREANVFELKEEKDYDKEEEEKKSKAQAEKKLAKRTQKALMKREKNFVYEDDSDGNPYSSTSESEDSEAERLKEEERKKAEEAAQADKAKSATAPTTTTTTTAEKVPSAPSSVKGASTPNRVDKKTTTDPLTRKGILKRPGSPNLSEASGSESSRKKLKKQRVMSGTAPSAAENSSAALGASISRPHSPAQRTQIRGGGSPSDAEASDSLARRAPHGGLQNRAVGTPSAMNISRPTSPGNSRPGSPGPVMTVLPTSDEIRARLPPEGIGLQEFMKPYSRAVKEHKDFGQLIKANSRFDKASKVLFPKEVKPAV